MNVPAVAQMLAVLLLAVGMGVVLLRRNVFFILMGVELMLAAAGLSFTAYGRMHGSANGQAAMIFVMALAAAEACVFLALVIACFRAFGTADLAAFRPEPEAEPAAEEDA